MELTVPDYLGIDQKEVNNLLNKFGLMFSPELGGYVHPDDTMRPVLRVDDIPKMTPTDLFNLLMERHGLQGPQTTPQVLAYLADMGRKASCLTARTT